MLLLVALRCYPYWRRMFRLHSRWVYLEEFCILNRLSVCWKQWFRLFSFVRRSFPPKTVAKYIYLLFTTTATALVVGVHRLKSIRTLTRYQFGPFGIVVACVSVCVCINPEFIRGMTLHPFNLGSPKFDQKCKRPWLRFHLFSRGLTLTVKVKTTLKVKIYPS